MAALVTLAEAQLHLGRTDPASSAHIQRKVEQASAIIIEYVKGTTAPTWTSDTAPPVVKAAVLLMLGHLWGNRGDDDMKTDAALWEAIGRLLMRQRDPALA